MFRNVEVQKLWYTCNCVKWQPQSLVQELQICSSVIFYICSTVQRSIVTAMQHNRVGLATFVGPTSKGGFGTWKTSSKSATGRDELSRNSQHHCHAFMIGRTCRRLGPQIEAAVQLLLTFDEVYALVLAHLTKVDIIGARVFLPRISLYLLEFPNTKSNISTAK